VSLSVPLALSIIRASTPTPAITAKHSPLTVPRSIRLRMPDSPICTAAGISSGMPRFDASRLAVPAGTIARVAVGAGESVDTALCQPVSAPGEDHFRAAGKSAAHVFRGLFAL
jgi:hypothetical protein